MHRCDDNCNYRSIQCGTGFEFVRWKIEIGWHTGSTEDMTMKFRGFLIVVKDIKKAEKYYHDLFGLETIVDNDGNMILSDMNSYQ